MSAEEVEKLTSVSGSGLVLDVLKKTAKAIGIKIGQNCLRFFYTLEADETAKIVENQHYAENEPLKKLEYKERKAWRKRSKQLADQISDPKTEPEP